MKSLPKISILVPTFNNQSMIGDFLELLQKQSYPKKLLEILVLDGGSTDNTLSIAKKYDVRIIHNPQRLAEPAITLGMSKATGEIMMVLAVDNFLENPESLKIIAQVFDDRSIYAAFPKHESSKEDTIYTKYVNTFTDPYNHFVYSNAANARTFHKVYKTLVHNAIYDVYDYSSSPDKPLIAFAQGFAIRKGFVRKKQDAFDDVRPVLDLLDQKKSIAYIHSVPLYHHTIHSLDHFIRKQRWATRNALEKKQYGITHRVVHLSKFQQLRIKIWPLYAFSIVAPLFVGIVRAIQDQELLWLLEPYMCFFSACASFLEVIVYNSTNKPSVSRQ